MLTFAPSPALRGDVTLPGDKSMSHRAALFAALANGESRFENFLDAGVTRRMLDALEKLGVAYELENGTLTVLGKGLDGLISADSSLNCGNSATTIRLLAGAIAASGLAATLDGSDGLRRRPMNRIVLPLQEFGVGISSNQGRAPLIFTPRDKTKLSARTFNLNVASAQVKSCLMLAGLAANGPFTIIEPGPSRDHSERMLAAMGISIDQRTFTNENEVTFYETTVHPGAELQPISMVLPGDFSSAAFLITAALITPGSDILIKNVGLNPTRTGLLDAFLAMGGQIDVMEKGHQSGEPIGDLHVRHSQLKGINVDGPLVVRMIDEFPAFAVAASLASGETLVRGAIELRHKESDRIQSICNQLRAIGVEIEELPDGFRLPGSAVPTGGVVDSQGDHRIAMSLACAGLASNGPVSITNPNIIHESFPEFVPTLERLGARID